MKILRIVLVIGLIFLMALPVIAKRKTILKGLGPTLSSGRIALNSNPPRFEEAMAFFDTALINYGPTPEAYFYRGNIYAEYATSAYDLDKKIENFEKMAANHDSLRFYCASKDIKSGLKSKCADYIGIADSIKAGFWRTNFNDGIKVISRVDNELNPNIKSAADSAAIEKANADLKAAADSGKAFFKIALAVDPANYKSMEGMGLLYDRIGNSDSALHWLKMAHEMVPDSLNIIQSLAYAYIQKRDWANAIIFFKKFLNIVPDDINTILNTAVCYNNLQQFDSVYYYDQLAIRNAPEEASAWFDCGQIWLWRSQTFSDSTKYFKMEENDAESKKYQQLQNLALDSSAYYYCHSSDVDTLDMVALEQCAVVTMIRGNYEAAAEKFDRLTKASPGVIDFWINLGNSLIQLKKFDEAINPFEKASELDPTDKELLEILLSLYDKAKMTEKTDATIKKINALEGK